MPIFIIVPLYAFLGFAIKFIDQAYDEEMYSLKTANLLAVISGVVMGALMVFDSPFSTAFFLAMIVSLILARKIDNVAFAAGTGTALITLGIMLFRENVEFMWGVVVIFLVAGFIDEIMDEVAHRVRTVKAMEWFLHYRPFSDVAIVLMVLAGTFSWEYLVPYFAFTIGYLAMQKFTPMELGSSIKGVLMRAVNLRP
ncbi:MAG: hypothetical protein A4E32_00346 [Methanomassiliicoccales archaeon PtaU1.Bin124]|nr:MAG: hypothetical protein A4E32_00346 [Methanomassiliicoccales archaeon PtaU1.Bin124]